MPSPSPPPCPFSALVKFPFSADNAAELSLSTGDTVTVLSTADPGWWEGQNNTNGQTGLFPQNYVEVLKAFVPSKFPLPQQPPPLPAGGARGPSSSASSKAAPPLPAGRKSFPITTKALSASPVTIAAPVPIVAPVQYAPLSAVQYPAARGGLSVSFRPNSTRFGHWAWNMALMTGVANVVLGVLAIIWYVNDPVDNSALTQWIGVYTLCISVLFSVVEYTRGLHRSEMPYPLRGLTYVALSIPMYFAMPTILGGVFTSTTGVVNTAACLLKEAYVPEERPRPAAQPSVLARSSSFREGLRQYWRYLRQQNQLGVVFFVALYACGNVAIFTYQVIHWTQLNAQTPIASQLSAWAPWAKGFGGVLDLNCALIVLPVCRTIIRYLYTRSTADQGVVARTLRTALAFMPIDHNLAFHKLIAKVIMVATIGHVIIHLINASLAYTNTINKFGIGPWWTGGVVSWAMLLIFSSVQENVKNKQFEIFWYCHHSFIIFFVVLFCHGHGGLNPNFPFFFALPGFLYVCERLLRYTRSRQPINILSVTLMSDVFSLEFSKDALLQNYKEGQYLYLQCPAVSRLQWHPFTISSAPQEKSVTVHIRVQGEGSWTRNVSDYIGSMGGAGKAYFELDRMGAGGKIHGKILGPDGKQMIRIDGPHSAPTQHIGEYSTCMVIGAGIGATPLSSCLMSVVFHKWKYTVGACFPEHAHFYWVCGWKDVDAFRWLIRRIKECQDEVIHMRGTNAAMMRGKSFTVHIFLTSAPKNPPKVAEVQNEDVGFWGVPSADRHVTKQGAKWTEMDLYRLMKCPQGSGATLDDVRLYVGRPDWKERFGEVSESCQGKGDVGVLYCGNPMIGTDLQKQCHGWNQRRCGVQGQDVGLFKLHKENF